MKQFKRNFGALVLSILAVTVLVAGGVSARGANSGHTEDSSDDTVSASADDSSSNDSPDDSNMATTSNSSTDDNPSADDAAESSGRRGDDDAAKARVEQLENETKTELKAKRAGQKETKTLAARQKACTAREANLNNKIANYDKRATRVLGAYDSVFTKLQAFQATEKLTVPTYDTLVAEAIAKKTAATTAVDALALVTVDVDCASADPAAAVVTVKTAVNTTKSALKEYRTSVKNLLVALMTAKSDDGEKDTPDDSDSTPSTTNTPESN